MACPSGKNNVKAVIVSHSHFDHSIDAPYFAMETNSILMGSESTINIGRGIFLNPEQLKRTEPDEKIKSGAFTLSFIESAHGPALFGKVPYPGSIDNPLIPPQPAKKYKLGRIYSILISHPAGTIVHHGSAGFISGMYENIKAEVVLLGIGGRGDTETYLKNIPLKLGARLVIPIHFDNFFRPLGKRMTKLPGVRWKEFLAVVEKFRENFGLKILTMGEKSIVLPAHKNEF